MDAMTEWIDEIADSLGVNKSPAVGELLDVTRDVAHDVNRPAAPLTLYLIGLAVGAGMAEVDAVAKVREHIARHQRVATD